MGIIELDLEIGDFFDVIWGGVFNINGLCVIGRACIEIF